MTVDELQAALDRLDKGRLYGGGHKAGSGEFCAVEFRNAVLERPHSDAPQGWLDLRRLNDGFATDAARTAGLLPVMAAVWDWEAWAPERQRRFAESLAIGTVREIVTELPRLTEPQRQACRAVTTLSEAQTAAAYAAADADAAADAAAAYAAAAAARDRMMSIACALWVRCAEESQSDPRRS
jgi:hypothetical protein